MTLDFFQLSKRADDLNIQYVEVKPNLQYHGLNEAKEPIFSFEVPEKNQTVVVSRFRFLLDPQIGLSAFREKVRGVIDRKELTSWYYKGNKWDYFSTMFNVVNQTPKKKNKTYILALSDSRAIGLMTHYNFVAHQTLLDNIKAAGLAGLTDGWFTNHEMNLRVRINSLSQGFSYLKITNGFTGTVSLRYHFGVEIGPSSGDKNFQFSEPLEFARKRHLSKVGELLGTIDTAVAVVRDIKIMDSLANMKYTTAYNIMLSGNGEITKRQQVLIDNLKAAGGFETALDLITFLGGYRHIRGYANSVDTLCDPIVNLALMD